MVGRSEQLFFSPVESAEDNLLHLPAFLEALASIVKEMGEVCVCVWVYMQVCDAERVWVSVWHWEGVWGGVGESEVCDFKVWVDYVYDFLIADPCHNQDLSLY